MSAVYFLAGVLSTVVGLLLLAERPRKRVVPRRWAGVERLAWDWRFEHSLAHPMSGNEVALVVAELMRLAIEERPLPDFELAPADYSITLGVVANFVRREEDAAASTEAP